MKKKSYTVKHRRYRSRRSWGGSEPGYRASRLAETRRSRRRRKFMVILIGGVILSVVLFTGIFLLLRSRGDGGADAGQITAGAGGEISSVVMTVTDEAGSLSLLMVVAPVEGGGFRAVTIPGRTVAEVPGQGFRRMDETFAAGGRELLDQTVADLIQYPVQYHVELDYEALLLAAEQVGTIDMRTARDLSLAVGGSTFVLKGGDNMVDSRQAVSCLGAAAADGNAGPEVQAVFFQGLRDAFLARSESDRSAFAVQLYKRADTDLDEDRFTSLFMAVTGQEQDFTVRALPVTLAGEGPDWYLEPVPGEVESILGGEQESPFTLEVQNGTEATGVVEAAAGKLAPLGISTTLKPEASGVNFEFTQIRYGSDATREANRVYELLGAGTLIKDDYLEKTQIIVIIGRDLAVSLQGS